MFLNGSRRIFAADNTIVVVSRPTKHIINKPNNIILPKSWNYRGALTQDAFLLDVLHPWIQQTI